MDISELQGLLSQFGPTEEEKRQAKMQAIAQFGFGLLGARKGDEFRRAGQSAQYAMQSQADALAQARQAKMQGMQAAGQAMGLQETMRKFADDDAARKILMQPSSTQGTQSAGVTSSASASSSSLYTQLLAKADALEAGGLPQKAQEYRMLAEKYAPKYKGLESVSGPDGKPRLLQTYENQAPTETSYLPKPDFKQVDTGGGVGFVDPWLKQEGPAFAKTMTPEGQSSRELGLAHLQLSRNADARAAAAASEEKKQMYGTPIQVTGEDGSTALYAPMKGSNQMVPMVDSQGRPVTKTASIPQAYKDKSYNLANLSDSLKEYKDTVKGMSLATYTSPTAVADLGSKYTSLKMGLKNLYELGALAGPDMAILEQQLSDPVSAKGVILPKSAMIAQIAVAERMLQKAEANLAKSYNQKPVSPANPGGLSQAEEAELERLRAKHGRR